MSRLPILWIGLRASLWFVPSLIVPGRAADPLGAGQARARLLERSLCKASTSAIATPPEQP